MDEDFVEGFEAPLNPPQLEAEESASLADLIMTAPAWNESMALELVVLARRHVAVRSLIGFPLEMAKQEQGKLQTEDATNEIFRAQGAVRALARCNEIIYGYMTAAEAYLAKIAQDKEEEDDSPQSPQHVP